MRLRARHALALVPVMWLIAAGCSGAGGDGSPAVDVVAGSDEGTTPAGDVPMGDDSFVLPDDSAAIPGEDTLVPPDVPGAEDDAGTIPPCCSAAECSTMGLVCNTMTCQCEPAASGPCAYVGQLCAPNGAQPAGFVCVASEADPATGNCLETCDAGAGCPFGAACLEGVCYLSECVGFFMNDCPAGHNCVPFGNGFHGCIAHGPGAADAVCAEADDCGPELLCVGGICQAPTCDDLGTACPAGQECSLLDIGGETLGVGFCFAPCEPFAEPEDCPAGEWCLPSSRSSATGALEGTCIAATGTAGAGDDCIAGGPACGAGLICVAETCYPVCDTESDTTGSGACDGVAHCVPLTSMDGQPLPFGACFPSCTPWEADPVAAGCGADEWCLPDFFDAAVGNCVDGSGTGQMGDVCGDGHPSCAPGTMCLGSTDGASCATICHPNAAAPTDPGADLCSATEACFPLFMDDGQGGVLELTIGQCGASCDHDAGTPCEDPTLTCVVGEMNGAEHDLCVAGLPQPPLAEHGDCTDAGLNEYAFCGPVAVCLNLGSAGGPEGNLCWGMCRAALGPLGSTGHPDCARDDALCTQLFADGTFGVCF